MHSFTLSFSLTVLVFPIHFSHSLTYSLHLSIFLLARQLNTTTNYFSNEDTGAMHHSSSQSINSLPNQHRTQSSGKSEQSGVPIKHHIRGLEHSASMSSFGNAMFDPLSISSMPGVQHSANMPPLPPPRRKKLNPNEVSIFFLFTLNLLRTDLFSVSH